MPDTVQTRTASPASQHPTGLTSLIQSGLATAGVGLAVLSCSLLLILLTSHHQRIITYVNTSPYRRAKGFVDDMLYLALLPLLGWVLSARSGRRARIARTAALCSLAAYGIFCVFQQVSLADRLSLLP